MPWAAWPKGSFHAQLYRGLLGQGNVYLVAQDEIVPIVLNREEVIDTQAITASQTFVQQQCTLS